MPYKNAVAAYQERSREEINDQRRVGREGRNRKNIEKNIEDKDQEGRAKNGGYRTQRFLECRQTDYPIITFKYKTE